MPPGGLYSVPRHHLYGGQMARRSFNSNDFHPSQDGPTGGVGTQPLEGAAETKYEDEHKRDKKKRKKKHSLSDEKSGKPPADSNETANTKADGSEIVLKPTKEKKKKKKKRAMLAQEHGEQKNEQKKKRKRESESQAATPTATRARPAHNAFEVGKDRSDHVKASLNGLEAPTAPTSEAPQATGEPFKTKKKKKHSSRKSEETRLVIAQQPGEVCPDVQGSVSEKPAKKHRKKHRDSTPQETNAVMSKVASPRKTPVPLPQLSRVSITSTMRPLYQDQAKGEAVNGVLVPETPPSKKTKIQAPHDIPVPVSQSQPTAAATTGHTRSKKERLTVLLSTPTSAGDGHTPQPAPPVFVKPHKAVSRPSVPNALTDANLGSFTEKKQSTNRQAKPIPRAKAPMSSATSAPETTVSSQNMSIEAAFARAGKPNVPPGRGGDSFIKPEVKKKPYSEIHEEASADVFNVKFSDLQQIVNFSKERVHLETYLAWCVDNNVELPCLGKATGCTAKKEEILRLSREEDITISDKDTEGIDPNALDEYGQRARNAEELLMLALKARLPVPIGLVEGTWALYCPRYAERHFDRYGYGQRTLRISPIAGFKQEKSYIARLSIPPRSMTYSILAFSPPPHASFRTTTIITATERYEMEVIFLGSGYLQLRVDLNLLLKGKATEEREGKKVHMEFIGVHEHATRWWEKKDELEEEAKGLFAKYDGGTGDE